MQTRLVALLSDFGYSDSYVGVMKGVILRYNPELELVDIAHALPPFQISSAAYTLYASWNWFPERTVFLTVVDPGVGSQRRELIVQSDGRAAVMPDNGSVSVLAARQPVDCYRASEPLLAELADARPQYSHTFDGRDLFAPLAARLASGEFARTAGTRCTPVLLPECERKLAPDQTGIAHVVHIDHFGNCITSLHQDDTTRTSASKHAGSNLEIELPGQRTLSGVRTHFAEVHPGGALLYWGSSGFLEIAVREGSAAEVLDLRIGTALTVRL